MLLAIDVGNTNIVLGVFDGAALVQSWRLQTLRERTSDELGLLVDGLFAHSRHRTSRRSPASILGSVVPPLTGTIRAMVQRYFGVTAAASSIPASTPACRSCYDNPAEVGADRIVNAIAAYETVRQRTARPLIVVDFGTATTLDAISGERRVPRRRDLSGRHDFGRRAVPAGGAPAAHRRAQAGDGRRADDGRRDGVGAVLRICRDGRGAGAAHERRARRQRAVHRDRRARDVIAPETAAHRPRGRRPDAPGPADRVGAQPVAEIADCRLRIADFRFWIADLGFADCRVTAARSKPTSAGRTTAI